MRGVFLAPAFAVLASCLSPNADKVSLPWGEPRLEVTRNLIAAYEECPECAIERLRTAVQVVRWAQESVCVMGVSCVVMPPDVMYEVVIAYLDSLKIRVDAGKVSGEVERAIVKSYRTFSEEEKRAALTAVLEEAKFEPPPVIPVGEKGGSG